MTWQEAVALILLALGVGVALLGCLGVLLMRGALARLHYLGVVSGLAVPLIAAALIVERPVFGQSIKTALIALILGISGPVLTHATARAIYLREHRERLRQER